MNGDRSDLTELGRSDEGEEVSDSFSGIGNPEEGQIQGAKTVGSGASGPGGQEQNLSLHLESTTFFSVDWLFLATGKKTQAKKRTHLCPTV